MPVAEPRENAASVVRHRHARGCKGDHPVASARRRAGLTQTELGERVGAGRVHITRIEGGHISPSVRLALAIARELDEPVEMLFGGER